MAELCLPFTHAHSERVVLRKAAPDDLDAYVEASIDREVRRFLGGPVSGVHVRARIRLRGIASITAEPRAFFVASPSSGELLGTVMLERRPAHRPGHVRATADEAVLVVTQLSNTPSLALALARRLGFEHMATISEFNADQWLGDIPQRGSA